MSETPTPRMDAPRRWPEMLSVWYDDPAHTSTEPLPTIERSAAKEADHAARS